MRGNLRGPGDRNDLHRAARPREKAACNTREDSRHSPANDLIESFDSAVLSRCDYQPTPPKIEVETDLQRSFRLAHQVPASYAGVGCAVRNELRNVLSPNEDGLELAAEGRGQCTLASRADRQPGIGEQLSGFFRKAALVRKCDLQHGVTVIESNKKKARPGTGRGVWRRKAQWFSSSVQAQNRPGPGDVAVMRVMVAAAESHETQRNGANHWASMRAGTKGAPDPAADPESRGLFAFAEPCE